MSICKPSESVADEEKSDTSMKLSLHSAGDHNGNALPTSSSSSPSISLGESSPDSLCSRSSISSGYTVSPQDYDMLEVTLTTTLLTETKEIEEDDISNCEHEDKNIFDKNNDGAFTKMQTANEMSESNDNSLSVYLDASAGEHQETRNDNDNLALSPPLISDTEDHGNNCDNRNRKRHGSSTPDSEETEILVDDDVADHDDAAEDEALYFSISSDFGARRTSTAHTNSPNPSLFSRVLIPEHQLNNNETMNDPRSEVGVEEVQIMCPLTSLGKTSEDISGTTHKLAVTPSAVCPVQEAKDNVCLLNCTEKYEKPAGNPSRLKLKSNIPLAGASKMSNGDENRVSKLDLKNIKAKAGSRPTPSPPKITGQNKSASAIERKASPRKEEMKTFYGGKRQRPYSGTVKVADILKPIRGKNTNNNTSHKTAASDSKKSKRQSLAFSGTLSDCAGAMHTKVTEEQCTVTPRKLVQELSDKSVVNVECKNKSSIPGEECVEDYWEDAGEALLTLANLDKPKNHSWKVSNLGPTVRQPGKSIRVDKGPVPPPGPEGPRLRQSQTNGPILKEVAQSAWDGSPVRVRHVQSQSHGVSKPRTTPEQPTSPSTSGFSNSNLKTTSSLQPTSVVCGRPVLNAASKLPVKGLPSSLNFPVLGCNENNGPTSKASPKSSCIGTRSDERASRSNPSIGSPSGKKTWGPSSSCDSVTSFNSTCVTAVPKSHSVRGKALSPQSRTTATGVKVPSVNNQSTVKTATANQTAKTSPTVNQVLTKQPSHFPLQRITSARLSGLSGTVDKNKPRDVHARSTNNRSSSPLPALAPGNKQQNLSRAQGQDVVNTSVPVTPVYVSINAGLGTTGPSAPAFKARTSSRSSPKNGMRLQSASKPAVVAAKPNQSKEITEKKKQASHLWKLVIQANKKVEAFATVIQHLFKEHEEAFKLKTDLSLELAKLKEELVASSQCCDRLHKEKEEARINLEEALKRLDEQRKDELVQLEERLRSFYQTEWDKVHQTYQEEADKCRMLMEQQVEETRTKNEAERKNQEVSHRQIIESLKQQHETSLQDLKRIQEIDLENLNKTLKETETTFSDKIDTLSAENAAMNEKLKAEEERRMLSDKNLKDSHTLYLEQELESLKVVLEIKNNQLHQKEKKLMEMNKLVETNVKLEECLTKIQQENEDYKARMDKHAALSKQLSNEQVKLQQTLQNESKVNKRLSMENEELLWKLHNGDLLGSPRRLSPTSPFSSPRNSASFPAAAPLSPR
ncbi:microtubule-associated tumor suppressor 1 homolog isoform X1 [Syngnathus acus]|uniref:microtubule-associated tumor suppressor 1 homolog isoform X1 n=1 Tax=Syngnathus acus TaxID=161584 RepID=UPI0018861AB1|nr:microtubule-associated tumor suppressor 1 homolog isoform X1 [Syngnathus acus]XP_037110133.1 microtubule-associated tumor suppressor 1 homolog isoform X1 [Syngnathus acus]